jgi:hypothetical protein
VEDEGDVVRHAGASDLVGVGGIASEQERGVGGEVEHDWQLHSQTCIHGIHQGTGARILPARPHLVHHVAEGDAFLGIAET